MDYTKRSELNQTSSGLPIYEFIIGSAAEISTLPTTTQKNGFAECVAAGSTAAVKDLSAVFLLSSDGWNKL